MMLVWIIVLISLTIIAVLLLIPGYTPRIKDSQGNVLKDSIASLEKIKLGGVDQWILIRGVNVKNPIILFLHGGPGTADMNLIRQHMRELEKHFVVVAWDQRGAGKSFAARNPESSMNIDQFISDIRELTEMLCHRFGQNKIFLVGHSWGSVLGFLTVQKYPGLYHAYIGVGQVANLQENEKVSYGWTLEQAKLANDRNAADKLLRIGAPPYTGDWQKKLITERRLLGKFGGEFHNSNKGAFPLFLRCLFRSTEYTITDRINFFRGIYNSIRVLWPGLMKVNLIGQVPKLNVPVFFALGKHDYECPHTLAEEYFKVLDAPHKELIWFENSAHFPNIEENEKFTGLLIGHVLQVVKVQMPET